MSKLRQLLLAFTSLLFTAILTAGCGGTKEPQAPGTKEPQAAVQKVELNVSGAVSLKDALNEIQKKYQEKNPNVKLIFNLGASGTLQKQIEQGAPADLFISAALKQMDELEAKNLIDKSSRKNLLENKLVMIVPKSSSLKLEKYEDLIKDEVKKFGIGEPEVVPAGQYAKQVLEQIGLWDKVKEKAVLAKDVRTVLAYVETGNVEAGIVYRTDTARNEKVQIVAEAPPGSHKPILYPAAILSGAKQPKEAAEFLAYLIGNEGKSIFEKYGFRMAQ